jgi:predicted GH43/DUF377 family glycosyl hydrolase
MLYLEKVLLSSPVVSLKDISQVWEQRQPSYSGLFSANVYEKLARSTGEEQTQGKGSMIDQKGPTEAEPSFQAAHLNPAAAFTMQRLGILAEPAPDNPHEAWGILNPGAARGRDGQLYLFPRVIAKGIYSRIALARVLFDAQGRPSGIERLGYVLEPTAPYEQNPISGGGCEDARVSYLRPLDVYVMVYTAFSPVGARMALAISHDLFTWQRLGLVRFAKRDTVDFSVYDNKDGLFFPDIVTDTRGRQRLALLHRPNYEVLQADGTRRILLPPGVGEPRPSIWIGYVSLEAALRDPRALTCVEETELLAVPEQPWESNKIGGGTPPVITRYGWLLLYHGVSGRQTEAVYRKQHVRYQVGVMVLDAQNPRRIRYRSHVPVMVPELTGEQEGMVRNVLFPAGIDQRPEPGDWGCFDVYYGMADTRLGVARLHIPETFPEIK